LNDVQDGRPAGVDGDCAEDEGCDGEDERDGVEGDVDVEWGEVGFEEGVQGAGMKAAVGLAGGV
jgi:hypothetical protein